MWADLLNDASHDVGAVVASVPHDVVVEVVLRVAPHGAVAREASSRVAHLSLVCEVGDEERSHRTLVVVRADVHLVVDAHHVVHAVNVVVSRVDVERPLQLVV